MINKFTFWFVCFPDLPKPIGGIKQIHRVAELLVTLGHKSYVIQDDALFHPQWFESSVLTISKDEWYSRSDLCESRDIIVLPETYLPFVNSCFLGIKKIIFNQNAAYSFGHANSFWKPESVLNAYSHSDVIMIWCVSQHDYKFLLNSFSLDPQRIGLITNGLEYKTILSPLSSQKKYQIAYMPRKNPHDSSVVISLIKHQPWFSGWSFKEISNVNHDQVISIFQHSLIFLAFGHPEGFGLPVAESLACGCSVVGYSGLGGDELFTLASTYGCSVSVPFGDWNGFIVGVKNIIEKIRTSPSTYVTNARAMAEDVRQQYSLDEMRNSLSLSLMHIRL